MNPAAVFAVCALFYQPGNAIVDSTADSTAVFSDPWFSQDKFMHCYASAGICGSAFYLFTRRLDRDAGEGIAYSVSVTGLIGLGKETYDRIRKKRFSMKDLVWDAAGIAAAYFVFMHQY